MDKKDPIKYLEWLTQQQKLGATKTNAQYTTEKRKKAWRKRRKLQKTSR